MFLSPSQSSLWPLFLLLSSVGANYIDAALSFGHTTPISPHNHLIPNWQLQGDPVLPQLLSDRVILTPPWPGNRRASLWSSNAVPYKEWMTEVYFRATGPERGGGNMQVWYTKEGKETIGTASIHTVKKFDGLALVVDTNGGRGGSVRGFLNDGTIDYANHHNIDALAFAHCDFPYRNLGRPLILRLKQARSIFIVEIDNKPCFQTDKVSLPENYILGISAGSAETPDSFEVSKLITTTPMPPDRLLTPEQVRLRNQGQAQSPSPQPVIPRPTSTSAAPKFTSPPDTPAASIKTPEEQFSDLHNRLQSQNRHLGMVYSELMAVSEQLGDVLEALSHCAQASQISLLDGRIAGVEATVQAIRADVEARDYGSHIESLRREVRESHRAVTHMLPETVARVVETASPRIGFLLFVAVGAQLVLAASYVVYKRRKSMQPKKYV
ncbi:MAG: hypothetical protein M1829_001914 [Trizodia sp. TS-e1964]|nr:MAG: hypothetical protein M1829_001914 [Trizodia sp. TS-e1964]